VGRYIVRYTGKGAPPAGALEGIAAATGVHVVDRAGRMLLVDAEEEQLLHHAISGSGVAASDWLVAPEMMYAQPDPSERVKGPPPEAGSKA
jgi:hypothetical protein